MKIDTQEMRQVAATQAPRMDMYAGIHKALRALMADTLLAVGRMDGGDDLELAQTTQRVVELLDFCSSHLAHENEFVHAAIEARAPGASAAIAHEHEEHERHIAGAQAGGRGPARQPGRAAAGPRAGPVPRAGLVHRGQFPAHARGGNRAQRRAVGPLHRCRTGGDPRRPGGVDPAGGDDVRDALDGAVHEPGRARRRAGRHAGPCARAGVRRGAGHGAPAPVDARMGQAGAQPGVARRAGRPRLERASPVSRLRPAPPACAPAGGTGRARSSRSGCAGRVPPGAAAAAPAAPRGCR